MIKGSAIKGKTEMKDEKSMHRKNQQTNKMRGKKKQEKEVLFL